MALIGERAFLATKPLSQATMGRDDEVIRHQPVLFLPAKYRMRRGTAEYELDFNVNGRTYSEAKPEGTRTCEPNLERQMRLREVFTDSRLR
jgi:hypothetical protein